MEIAKLVTQEMGKVLAEAEEECDGLFKDDYLDLIEAANAPQVRQSRRTMPAHCARPLCHSSSTRDRGAHPAKCAAPAPTLPWLLQTVENGLIVREAHGVVAVCSPWNFPADEALVRAPPTSQPSSTKKKQPVADHFRWHANTHTAAAGAAGVGRGQRCGDQAVRGRPAHRGQVQASQADPSARLGMRLGHRHLRG